MSFSGKVLHSGSSVKIGSMKHIRTSFTSNRTDFIKLAGAGVGLAILNPATALRADELVRPRGYVITTGQVLNVDDYLASTNGKFWAIMQFDGNFCIYRNPGTGDVSDYVNPGSMKLLWSSAQAGGYKLDPGSGHYFAEMQDDGNFCIYQGSPDNKRFLWGSVQAAGYQPVRGHYAA